jgi:hypothetical protein
MNNLTPDPASGGVMPTPEAKLTGLVMGNLSMVAAGIAESDPEGRPAEHHLGKMLINGAKMAEAAGHDPVEWLLALMCPTCWQALTDYLGRKPHGTICERCRVAFHMAGLINLAAEVLEEHKAERGAA